MMVVMTTRMIMMVVMTTRMIMMVMMTTRMMPSIIRRAKPFNDDDDDECARHASGYAVVIG